MKRQSKIASGNHHFRAKFKLCLHPVSMVLDLVRNFCNDLISAWARSRKMADWDHSEGQRLTYIKLKLIMSRFQKCMIARWALSLKAVTWPRMLRNSQKNLFLVFFKETKLITYQIKAYFETISKIYDIWMGVSAVACHVT